jgi:hypothetical protein
MQVLNRAKLMLDQSAMIAEVIDLFYESVEDGSYACTVH